MPTFGFSAFLKLVSLNERPQRAAIRGRFRPSTGGYDFHRSLRLRANRFLVADEPIDDVLASCSQITKPGERHSALSGLQHLSDWRFEHPGTTIRFQPKTFESPGRLFKVHFEPDFGLAIDGLATAAHIYNTAVPIVPRMAYAALSLFTELYSGDQNAPQDLAVLSLREPLLYRLREAPDHALMGSRLVAALESRIADVRNDLGLPPPPASGPHAPPPN